MTMTMPEMYALVGRRFRKKRMYSFRNQFLQSPLPRIIDVGGSAALWSTINYAGEVTIVNLDPHIVHKPYRLVIADGRNLPFPDKSFDLAFCNSLIDHVGDEQDQKQLAHELFRVAHRFYLQTPNKWFPIEPHFLGVFLHWLPRRPYWLIRYATIWGLVAKPSPNEAHSVDHSIRLLTRSNLECYFPNCIIKPERVFGLTKSFIVLA